MIFNKEIHEDFMKIVTRYGSESEPLWTPEKGYKTKNTDFPENADRETRQTFMLELNEANKENYCKNKALKVFIHSPNEIVTPYHDFIYLRYDEFMEFKVKPHGHKTDEVLKSFSPEL